MNNYHPRYWLINGRGFPDSIADNYASWLPDPALRGAGRDPAVRRRHAPATRGWPATSTSAPRTTRSTRTATTASSSVATAEPLEGAGRRGRVVREVRHQRRARARPGTCSSSGTTPRTTTRANPVPVTVPDLANQEIGDVLQRQPVPRRRQSTLPPGIQTLNQCGEYYIISHNHALYPDHLVGRQHDRADHVHADRPARP